MQNTQLCVSKFEYLHLKWLRYVVAFMCHCIPFVIIQDRFMLCSQISHKKHPTHLSRTVLNPFKVDKFLIYDIAFLSKLSKILPNS